MRKPCRRAEVKALLADQARIKIHLEALPPYAPDLNPVEWLWRDRHSRWPRRFDWRRRNSWVSRSSGSTRVQRVAISHGVLVRQVDAIQRDGRPIRECLVGGRLGVAKTQTPLLPVYWISTIGAFAPSYRPRPLTVRSALTSLARSARRPSARRRRGKPRSRKTSSHEHEPFRAGPPLAPGLRHRRSDRTMSRGELAPGMHDTSYVRLDHFSFK